MADIEIHINGKAVSVPVGTSVVAALVIAGQLCTRRSVTGELRFAVCGMGQCQECRVTIDGLPHRLACQSMCRHGMEIDTGLGKAGLAGQVK